MHVSLFIKRNSSNVLNDIDVVCKSILLSSLKKLLISLKQTFFEKAKIFIWNVSRIFP